MKIALYFKNFDACGACMCMCPFRCHVFQPKYTLCWTYLRTNTRIYCKYSKKMSKYEFGRSKVVQVLKWNRRQRWQDWKYTIYKEFLWKNERFSGKFVGMVSHNLKYEYKSKAAKNISNSCGKPRVIFRSTTTNKNRFHRWMDMIYFILWGKKETRTDLIFQSVNVCVCVHHVYERSANFMQIARENEHAHTHSLNAI